MSEFPMYPNTDESRARKAVEHALGRIVLYFDSVRGQPHGPDPLDDEPPSRLITPRILVAGVEREIHDATYAGADEATLRGVIERSFIVNGSTLSRGFR